jgi:membrane protease subunit (stomatin/prohibitin family)
MPIFRKNPNEEAYTGGKKHFADVIKNTGPGELLIWLNNEEDFNTNSTLIVAESEEALFFKDGIIQQVFDGGKYTLSTNNYSFISRLRNAMTGGVSTFNCKVYFVRKAHSMEIRWGTDSPIQVRDPVQGIQTFVQARGAYKIQIDDSKKFLIKLLGNNIPLMTQTDMTNYFRSQFTQHIKSNLSQAIQSSNQEILGISSKLGVLAESIFPLLQKIIDEYGIKLINFTIEALDIPANDPNRQKLEEAFSNKRVMGIMGPDWGKQQAADILKDLANNPGAGGVAAAGAGLGMGMAAGGAFGDLAHQMFIPMQQAQQPPPTSQPPILSNRFTQKPAGSNANSSETENPVEKIKQLKELLDLGAITQDEFDAKKRELLNRM